MTHSGLDQRTLHASLADAQVAIAEYDNALAWLEVAMKRPMDPIAAEVWAFDKTLERVLLVKHRWRGWVPLVGWWRPVRRRARRLTGNCGRRPESQPIFWKSRLS